MRSRDYGSLSVEGPDKCRHHTGATDYTLGRMESPQSFPMESLRWPPSKL